MRPELSADGVHPNAQGYALMATLTAPAIEQLLRR
jgi:lysophospholipase L1-like esterase